MVTRERNNRFDGAMPLERLSRFSTDAGPEGDANAIGFVRPSAPAR